MLRWQSVSSHIDPTMKIEDPMIARIKRLRSFGAKNAYELKGKFLDDLHNNAFSGTNGKDAVEHVEYYLKSINLIKLPNVDHDKLRIVVFPISLAGGARRWSFVGLLENSGDEIEVSDDESSDLEEYWNLEWYEALEDSELKDKALRNKAIMEGLISDDKSRMIVGKDGRAM
ncbi:hypothetical protein Tco_0072023 [Tanacetum coccineum]